MLQCVAVVAPVLQCVAVETPVLQCVAVETTVWQCLAVGTPVLQCVAVGTPSDLRDYRNEDCFGNLSQRNASAIAVAVAIATYKFSKVCSLLNVVIDYSAAF